MYNALRLVDILFILVVETVEAILLFPQSFFISSIKCSSMFSICCAVLVGRCVTNPMNALCTNGKSPMQSASHHLIVVGIIIRSI